eukprot:2010507-Amphidinium_carterae.1
MLSRAYVKIIRSSGRLWYPSIRLISALTPALAAHHRHVALRPCGVKRESRGGPPPPLARSLRKA